MLNRLTMLNRLCGALLVFVATLLLPTAQAQADPLPIFYI
jgi:hypothetical protein